MAAVNDPSLLWAQDAWVGGGWRARVLLRIGADGRWADVQPDVPAPAQASVLPGPVLPGVVNAHSHAFQRAFAGMAERRSGAMDDFWTWRDRMYDVALRISPEQLHAVAAQLYAELLAGGYTHVCEFHYLQHAPDGSRYADPLVMGRALARAAQDAGIGLTLLPVLYERAGFRQPALRDDQRRFATSVEDVIALNTGMRALDAGSVMAGVAIHSLRAAASESVAALADWHRHVDGPIHIHIAEQTTEVDECVAATGLRPIEWLDRHVALDSRWQLVHATHATEAEIEAAARRGAGVVICPTTEANLGDGLPDLLRWLDQRAMLAIGSDSHVTRNWPAELRLLEYGQRLQLHRRNVAAAPEIGLDATATRLFDRVLAGGAMAAGFDAWGLVEGARADFGVLDLAAPGLLGAPPSQLLDALVFAADAPAFREVWVAGQRRVVDGHHLQQASTAGAFVQAMRELWSQG